ncbi:hypothetical protein HG531_008401 [Fusarium graminearum]|nr:hypothetical protein HG531_008401 [Fusarium graminearum]
MKEEPLKVISPFSIPPIARRIDPTRIATSKPDGSDNNNDRVEIGPTPLAFREWRALGLQPPHLPTMRAYRLQRVRDELTNRDLGGILLFDPLNIRYATDTTNMQLWTTHNPARACFVAASGYVVLWDFHGCNHLSAHLPLINERRSGASFFYFETGNRTDEQAARFATQIDQLLRQHAGNNRRLAVDRIEVAGLRALDALGLDVCNGQVVTEHARMIKGPDEILAMRCAVASCEAAIGEMRQAMRAGATENDVWAALHAGNIRRGGEWIETRLLSSGPRTNPWYQECGPRVLRDGDLVVFDTDLIGVYGICVDVSRTWICGDLEPTAEQKRLYRIAHEHITTNIEMVKPGVRFTDLTRNGHRLPESCRAQRYGVMFHGVGLCDEYPSIRYPEDLESYGYEGEIQAGMVLCVEAYVGEVGGKDGVKLENQLLNKDCTNRDLFVEPPLLRIPVALLTDNGGLVPALTGLQLLRFQWLCFLFFSNTSKYLHLFLGHDTDHGKVIFSGTTKTLSRDIVRKASEQIKSTSSPRDLTFDGGYIGVPPSFTDDPARPGNLKFKRVTCVSNCDFSITSLVRRDLDRNAVEGYLVVASIVKKRLSLAVSHEDDLITSTVGSFPGDKDRVGCFERFSGPVQATSCCLMSENC